MGRQNAPPPKSRLLYRHRWTRSRGLLAWRKRDQGHSLRGANSSPAGLWNSASVQVGQRRLLGKRALFTPTGGLPGTPPRVHLHLSPLLPLPRGLFRQVNAHSLSKSCPTSRPLYAEAWVHDTSRRIHVIRYTCVFPSPSMCHPRVHVVRLHIAESVSLSRFYRAPKIVEDPGVRAFSTR